ncbi:MAG: insulinase family protein [Candidatus Omnitrophica bacterium]|nr:insulinase family protein [Candidatus Omnitrophota bacterium]
MPKEVRLENGLRVVVDEMPHMESVSIGVWCGVGGRHEMKRVCGISHFLEHIVFKGSESYTCRQIKEGIEGVGGALNGFTGEEYTCFLAKVPHEHLQDVFAILADMVQHPRIEKEDVEKERLVILEEIKMYKDLPSHYVHDLLSGVLWPKQPLGRPLTGDEKSMHDISGKDLRDYRNKFYAPSNLAVVACGGVNMDDLAEKAEKIFASKAKSRKAVQHKPADTAQKKPRILINSKSTEQTHLALGFHSPSRFDEDSYIAGLVNIVMGANMSSRLFQEVREARSLAYEIHSSVKEYNDTGAFVISAGIDNKNVVRAIEVVVAQLKKIKRAHVSKDEFRRAKDFYRGQLRMALEDTLSRMLWLGEKIISKEKISLSHQVLDIIDRITIEDIMRVANKIFIKRGANLALIGPASDKIRQRLQRSLESI